VLIGPPGSGKGTQAVRLAQRLGVPHISTGDILRAAVRAGSPLGRRVAALIDAGAFVGDELITDLVRDRLAAGDASRGFVLDGFPRTLPQAEALDTMRSPHSLIVLLMEVADEAIVRRLSGRRVCDACAITQSVSPVAEGHEGCPYCGGNLVRRADDDPDTVRRRLETHAATAARIVAYYRQRPRFAAIDGLQPADAVTAAMMACIERGCGPID
jgi:adenylate kinase